MNIKIKKTAKKYLPSEQLNAKVEVVKNKMIRNIMVSNKECFCNEISKHSTAFSHSSVTFLMRIDICLKVYLLESPFALHYICLKVNVFEESFFNYLVAYF